MRSANRRDSLSYMSYGLPPSYGAAPMLPALEGVPVTLLLGVASGEVGACTAGCGAHCSDGPEPKAVAAGPTAIEFAVRACSNSEGMDDRDDGVPRAPREVEARCPAAVAGPSREASSVLLMLAVGLARRPAGRWAAWAPGPTPSAAVGRERVEEEGEAAQASRGSHTRCTAAPTAGCCCRPAACCLASSSGPSYANTRGPGLCGLPLPALPTLLGDKVREERGTLRGELPVRLVPPRDMAPGPAGRPFAPLSKSRFRSARERLKEVLRPDPDAPRAAVPGTAAGGMREDAAVLPRRSAAARARLGVGRALVPKMGGGCWAACEGARVESGREEEERDRVVGGAWLRGNCAPAILAGPVVVLMVGLKGAARGGWSGMPRREASSELLVLVAMPAAPAGAGRSSGIGKSEPP